MNRWVQLGFAVFAALLLGATLFVRVGDVFQSASAEGTALLEPEPLQGPAPGFSLHTRDGQQVTLESLKGRTVLLNFWATWCTPCLQELPHIAALARKLKDRPITLVLISVDREWAEIDNMAKDIAGAHPAKQGPWKDAVLLLQGRIENVVLLLDPDEKTAHTYGTRKYPETYLIGPAGNLKTKFVGPKAWGREPAVEYLVKLTGGHLSL
jgi:thiol-disulfide isomerase/thioredoxin